MASMPQTYYGILAIIFKVPKTMSSITQKFGSNLKKLRRQQKMSQMELAQKSGLDLTTINELESGNRQPMLKTTWKIANALKVKSKDLLP